MLGTREILRLSVADRLKPVHAVGSYAVIDHSTATRLGQRVDENTELPSFAGLEGDYRKTRWASETMMRRAQARGLPVFLHRMSLLCGDTGSGLADPGEIAWRLAHAMIVTGSAPKSARPLDMLPIDAGVNAMLALARDPDAAPCVNHIIGDRSLSWGDLAEALRHLGHAIEELPSPEWYGRVRHWAERHPEDASIVGLMPLFNEGGNDHAVFFSVDGSLTRNRLEARGIDRRPADIGDLIRTLTYLTRTGALPEARV